MSSSPLASAVVHKLRSAIHSGELVAGMALPSERELAERFAVSRMVVRAAIHELTETGLIVAKARCRPIVRSDLRRSLPPTGNRSVAVRLWPNPSDLIAAQLLKGIQQGIQGQLKISVANFSHESWDSEIAAERAFLQSLVPDSSIVGAILWYLGGTRNLDALWEVRSANIPIVFVDRTAPAPFEGDFVGTDNFRGAFRAVEHLTNLGHKRVALITNCDHASTVHERELGYRQGLSAAGLPLRPEYIFSVTNDGSSEVERALDHLLGLGEPPTAILGINDHTALQVVEALNSRGVAIPRQMSVLGFDDLLRWIPGGGYLSSMRQEFDRVGQIAGQLIVERAKSGPSPTFRHILLDAPFIDQGSTASPAD